ncbi:MAG: phosphoribosyltransferase family protein [Campylobacterota bacterium]|nr:phosphoribosyltransferase family protein [Campylobacterota bacterium]
MECQKEIFKNREDAAKQLLEFLPVEKIRNESWDVISLSFGGLEIADVLNRRLKTRVDILFTEAVNAPQNEECEIARVSESEELVIHEALCNAFDIGLDFVYSDAHRKHEEQILTSIYQYRKGRPFPNIRDKVVVLIDDGSETGLKLLTAIKTVLAMKPKAVHVIVPIIPHGVLEALDPLVDHIYYLHDIRDYLETESYYENFNIISNEEIEKILGEHSEV